MRERRERERGRDVKGGGKTTALRAGGLRLSPCKRSAFLNLCPRMLSAPERCRYVLLLRTRVRAARNFDAPPCRTSHAAQRPRFRARRGYFTVITRLERRESRLTATFTLGASHFGDIAQLVVLFSYTYNIPIYRRAEAERNKLSRAQFPL